MGKILVFIVLLWGVVSVQALEVSPHCVPAKSDPAPVQFSHQFPWNQTPEEMKQNYDLFLKSERRFEYRGYWSEGRYLVPYISSNMSGVDTQETVELSVALIEAVMAHLQTAFQKGYAVYPFFSDMGHNHFLVPQEIYQKIEAQKLSARDRLQAILNLPEVKMLYHTVEQLKYMEQNLVIPGLEFLRENRNIVAGVISPENLEIHQAGNFANTVAGVEGYRKYSGVYMSVGQKGCFAFWYQGQKLWMDISLTGPTFDPSGPRF